MLSKGKSEEFSKIFKIPCENLRKKILNQKINKLKGQID